jgi:hypothetical protein
VFKSCELLSDFLPFTLWKYAPWKENGAQKAK